MAETKYRAAVIGCGGRGRSHAAAYSNIGEADLVACCDLAPDRREPVAEQFGIPAYADADEMIRSEEPDIVHIVTRPTARVDLMTVVAEADVPLCTVEKPIATAVTDWRALCKLEQTAETKFAVCHQTRWNPFLERCRAAIASGELGDLLLLHASAGMNIAGQGTHTLNYGLSLAGDRRVARVFGNACGWDTADTTHPGPETTVASLELEGGLRALWTSGPFSPRCGNPDTTHEHVRAAAFCENGRVEWQQFGIWEIVRPGGAEHGSCNESPEHWARIWSGEQADFHRAMFRWRETGEAAGTDLERSLHEWAVVLALYQSALEHRPVDLDGFDPPDDLVDRYRQAVGAE